LRWRDALLVRMFCFQRWFWKRVLCDEFLISCIMFSWILCLRWCDVRLVGQNIIKDDFMIGFSWKGMGILNVCFNEFFVWSGEAFCLQKVLLSKMILDSSLIALDICLQVESLIGFLVWKCGWFCLSGFIALEDESGVEFKGKDTIFSLFNRLNS
jgi:hypothetical protein